MQVSLDFTPSGILVVSCMLNDYRCKRMYVGVPTDEALADFSQEVLGGVPCYA